VKYRKKALALILPILALAMLAYQLSYHGLLYLDPTKFMIVHLGFAFAIVGITDALQAKGGSRRFAWILSVIASLATLGYLFVNWEALEYRTGYPNNVDMVFACVLIALVLAYTWKHWGPVFPVFALICLAYSFWGNNPALGMLKHAGGDWSHFLSYAALCEGGIFSRLLMLGAATIWIFIVFGNLLETARAIPFFVEVGKLLGRVVRGGAALVAVIASSLVGMCTGASVANVTITGTFTIPLMKSTGIKPAIAGAIECLASNGGQYVPPVLGAAAFLMVGFIGVPYVQIITHSIGTAFLYYLFLVIILVITASKYKWPSIEATFDKNALIFGGIAFLIPIGVLTTLLYQGYTPARCGYIAFGALVAISLIFKYNRPSLGALVQGFTKAITAAARLSIVVACLGMPIVILEMTGMVMRLGYIVEAVAGGELIIALLATHLVLLILGCGLPTVVAYSVAALVCAPVLVRMGLDPVVAHFFVFYNAVFASITPPIALTAVPAATLAQTRFWSVVKEAVIMSLPLYVIPYVFVYYPFILAIPGSNVLLGILTLLGPMAITIGVIGFMVTTLSIWERAGFIAAGVALLVGGIGGNTMLVFAGAGLFVAMVIINIFRWRQVRASPA